MLKLHFSTLNIVKKAPTHGSYKGMRYYLKSLDKDKFTVYVYPDEFCFESTPEDEKISKEFPLSEEGLQEVQTWLNDLYDSNIEKWKTYAN